LTSEQLAGLRDALPPFPTAAETVQGLSDYCQFYRLDFTAGYPGCEHFAGTVASGPHRLAVHRWQLPDATATLLLVHGYYDHTGLYGKLVEYGLSRGFNVLIFDLPGHGLSSGEPAAIDEFTAYGRSIASVVSQASMAGEPLWAMAQSTGCAALVEFAQIHPWPFAATVLLAPLVRPVSWMKVRLGHMLLRHFTDTLRREFNENSSDREFLAFIQADPLQARHISMRWVGALRRWLKSLPEGNLGVGQALVVQGDTDGTVDWRYNINVIIGLFPDSRVEYVAGAGHQLANESHSLRQHYFHGIDDYLRGQGLELSLRDNSPPS
jgi:lysophospholipase